MQEVSLNLMIRSKLEFNDYLFFDDEFQDQIITLKMCQNNERNFLKKHFFVKKMYCNKNCNKYNY